MTAHGEFWKERQPAAIFKHRLLTNYLTPWATMVSTRSPHRAVYVDGYAGSGRYDATGGEACGEPGSPVIAASIAAAVRGVSPARDLRCVFVERDPGTAAGLQTLLANEFADRIYWQVVCGDLSKKIGQIMIDSARLPVFMFLDPFGTAMPKQFLVDDVLKRAPTDRSVEVLLNFTIEGVWRIGGQLREGGHPPTIARADDFLGGTWWHGTFEAARAKAEKTGSSAPAASAAKSVASEYNRKLAAETGYSVLSVPVRRTPTSQPFFQLSLIHRHPVARLLFADAAAQANRTWRRHFWDRDAEIANEPAPGYVSTLFDAVTEEDWKREEDARQREVRERLVGRLRRLVGTNVHVSVSGSLVGIFDEDLGLATESDLRYAWKQLAKEGLVDAPPTGSLRTATVRQRT